MGELTFFISHQSRDTEWGLWIASEIEAMGHSTIIDKRDFVPGQNFMNRMLQSAEGSDFTVCVMSENFLSSKYARQELFAALAEDPIGEFSKVLIVLIEDCELPKLLQTIIYIDLRRLKEEAASEELKAQITRVVDSISLPQPEELFSWTENEIMFADRIRAQTLYESALDVLQGRARQMLPNLQDFHNLEEGNLTALGFLGESVHYNPFKVRVLLDLAAVLVDLGETESALRTISTAIQVANQLIENGDFDQANQSRIEFDEHPDEALTKFYLAKAYLLRGMLGIGFEVGNFSKNSLNELIISDPNLGEEILKKIGWLLGLLFTGFSGVHLTEFMRVGRKSECFSHSQNLNALETVFGCYLTRWTTVPAEDFGWSGDGEFDPEYTRLFRSRVWDRKLDDEMKRWSEG